MCQGRLRLWEIVCGVVITYVYMYEDPQQSRHVAFPLEPPTCALNPVFPNTQALLATHQCRSHGDQNTHVVGQPNPGQGGPLGP